MALRTALEPYGLDASLGWAADSQTPAVVIGRMAIAYGQVGDLDSAGQFARVDEQQLVGLAEAVGLTSAIEHLLLEATQRIHQAQSQHEDDPDWSLFLSDDRAIASLAVLTEGAEGVDEEFVEEHFRGFQGYLARVPTADITPMDGDQHRRFASKEWAYAKEPASTVPPLLLDAELFIEDGHHRHRVATKRGDVWLPAYVVVDEDLSLKVDPTDTVRRSAAKPG